MSYQQNHLFIDEPLIKNINKLTVNQQPRFFHYITLHPPISWCKSSFNFLSINTNHQQFATVTTSPPTPFKSFGYSNKLITAPRQPFSFLFTSTSDSITNTFHPFIKFTFLFCLFIFFYLFSSTIHVTQPSFKIPVASLSTSPLSNRIIPSRRMASDNCKSSFDVTRVCNCFRKYNEDPNSSSLDLYIEAYKELQKFFECLGTVFSFVTSDVESKINILESYRKDPKCGDEYVTLQSMMEYEAKNNLLRSEDRPSGARTLLRLHRALAFISKFILEVSKLEDSAATGPAARSAYQVTLAKYHPWVIRKTASLAMYGLPNREQLIIRAFGGEPGDDKDKFTQTMIDLAELSETAYNITNKLYEDNNLLDLP